MLVQQQIKSIQLSSDIAPGFTQTQYKSLGEKVHTFHSILDDLDLTLTASKNCIEKYAVEAQARRQEEERQKAKAEEEARRKLSEMQKPESSAPTSAFQESTPGTMLNEISKTGIAGSNQASRGSKNANNMSYTSDFNDLNDLDLTMFGGMEQNELGLADFGDDQIDTHDSGDKNTTSGGAYNPNSGLASHNDPNNNINTDMNSNNSESYLTLNDFNDLGLDWNNTENQNGLDMNEFNI